MSHQTWIHITLPTSNPPQFNQVLTGTEALLTSTSDDGTAQVVFLIEPVKDMTKLLMSSKRDAVHLLFTIYSDKKDIIGRIREKDVGRGRRTGLGPDSRHCGGNRNMRSLNWMM